jgi:hypothetical protein
VPTYAFQFIKRLLRTGKKLEEVREWVNNPFPVSKEMVTYVNDIPLLMLEMVSIAVMTLDEVILSDFDIPRENIM